MRVDAEDVTERVGFDAEEAADGGGEDHGRRPELVGGGAAERLEKLAREDFGDGAGIL